MSAQNQIPMVDLAAEHAPYLNELREALDAVLLHGQYIMGAEVAAFEAEIAEYLGVRHAVSCNSGTDALVLSLRALDIGRGDEVITTPFTFFATAEAISTVGATPVFVDIRDDTFTIDVDQVAGSLTPRTRAVLPVHLFGQPADLDELMAVARDHELVLVEDAAQALGARYGSGAVGTFGACGAFSFFPTKPLGGLGDGGLVTSDEDNVADNLRMLRQHGSRRKYENETLGYNSRLDTLQAAALRVKLRRLDRAIEGRQRAAQRYDERLLALESIRRPMTAPGRSHVYHQYTVRVPAARRGAIQETLQARGIASVVYYPVPLHLLPVYRDDGRSLPRSERAAAEVLSLPISPVISRDAIDLVADTLEAALNS